MTRAKSLIGLSAFASLLFVASEGCSSRTAGSVCTTSSDCGEGLVCVFARGASTGLCIEPADGHGALPSPGGPGGPGGSGLSINKDVDILFVIDNSGSMGEEQALLAQNFGAFIEVLEADDVAANYRIGVTTSDSGNPWCPVGTTTPEGGSLVLSSCKTRLGDFVFNNGAVDVQDLACNDICTLSEAELAITATTTDFDSTAAPRPWLENIGGRKNIPDTTSAVEAFKCFGPQGINGCGFESQLESMYLALKRAESFNEDEYGFLRADAILAIVIVTDEVDCSYNKDYAQIFEQDGNKVFWSDPNAAFPTSAVCWNAGVSCMGDPSNYTSCDPVNKDTDGNEGVSDAEAVLHPMSRYFGLLDGLEQQKRLFNPSQELIVALIGGVDAEGNVVYSDVSESDPEFQDNFGIGPGCTAPPPIGSTEPVRAVPPVRMRALVDRYTEDNMFSICEADYSEALEAIAVRIRDQIQPACYTRCVADGDSTTTLVEPTCVVTQDPPGNDNSLEVPECLRDAAGVYVIDESSSDYVMPSADDNVCHALLTDDANLSPSTSDDMSAECVESNYNLEFKIARRSGFPAPAGTSISATCALAEFPDVSCPGIGG